MAEIILNDNKEYIGGDIAEQAIEEINKSEEKEGEEANEEVKEKTTTRRKRTTTK